MRSNAIILGMGRLEMQNSVCCFTGHRNLPANKIEKILRNLDREIDNLIAKGVTDFMSGGALGFDQIAASLIVAKKEMYKNIRLIFALPCKNQDEKWNEEQRNLYKILLFEADEVIYVSDEYDDFCMWKRNNYMVEHSACCICALLHERSGTDQTVRYARKKGLRIVNVTE